MDEDDELKEETAENKVNNTINKGKSKLVNVVKQLFLVLAKKVGKWVMIVACALILFVLLFNELEKVIFTDVLNSVKSAMGGEDTDGDGVPDEDIDFAASAEIIKKDNTYCLKVDKEVFKKIEENLKENNIDPEDLNIKTGNFDCFKEFIKAEITTQYPQLGTIDKEKYKDSEDIITDGVIKIKRATDGKDAVQLYYTPQEEFQKLCDNNDSKALEYFSLDNDRNLLYASYIQTDVTVSNTTGDTSIIELPSNSSTYEIVSNSMDYLSIVKKYTMPFALQLAILQTSDSEDFALEFARLAQESEMVLTIQDNVEKNTYVEDISAEQHIEGKKILDYKIKTTDTITTTKVTTTTTGNTTSTSTSTSTTVNGPTVVETGPKEIPVAEDQKVCTAKVTTVVEENTPTLELTKVDCWNAKFENTYTYSDNSDNPDTSSDGPNTTETSEEVQCDINTDKDVADYITGRENYWKGQCPATTVTTSGNTTTTTSTTRVVTSEKDNLDADVKKITSKESTMSITTITKKYTTTRESAGSNEEKIFKIFSGEAAEDHIELSDDEKNELKKELKSAYGSLKDAQQWFYGLLKRDSQTVDFVDIMKYFITKYETGDGEYDFSPYDADEFTSLEGNGSVSYDSLNLKDSDLEILYKITEAERGGGTVDQKSYVASVVLNRVLSSGWPNTVEGVVFQANQFSPISDGRYYTVKVSDSTKEAVNKVVKYGDTTATASGNDEGLPAVYFMTPAAATQQSWLSNCIYLFNDTNGKSSVSHNFYTTKAVSNELEKYKSSSTGEFLDVAKKCWEKVCKKGSSMKYGGATIPITGSTIDCSSYVSWVLYEYGYKGFKGPQATTSTFISTNWNKKYGWTEISLKGGENPISKLQPGDLIVRNTGTSGHITLVVSIKNGIIYTYDCGAQSHWINNSQAKTCDSTYMLTDSRPGKVIRVTPPK